MALEPQAWVSAVGRWRIAATAIRLEGVADLHGTTPVWQACWLRGDRHPGGNKANEDKQQL